MHKTRPGWVAFGAFVALNAAWLYHDVTSDGMESGYNAAYAECRTAVRRSRADAARIPFPTTDLVHVSRHDSTRYRVRGFFAPRTAVAPVWYRCELTYLAEHRWRVDSVVFDR